MRFISTRQNGLLLPGKPRSPVGYWIAEVFPFVEFVELFAAFCDADRFSGHVAKDHDH
jgi:hypothetical protein